MATIRPVGSRFFAAFSRWSDCTRPSNHCSRHGRVSRLHRPNHHSRSFATTHSRRQAAKSLDDNDPVTELLSVSGKNPLSKNPENTILPKTGSSETVFAERMRTLMRCVPHPTIVITAALHNPELNSTIPQAMTASSFNTISIAPIPTIAFNIRLPSRTWDAIKSLDGHFRVHVLKNEKSGAAIADAFTRGDAQAGFRSLGPIINMKPGIDGTYGSVPKIEDPSVAAVLDCQLVKEMRVRDHVVMIAEVSNIHWDGERHDTLMYVSGAFKKIGDTLLDRS